MRRRSYSILPRISRHNRYPSATLLLGGTLEPYDHSTMLLVALRLCGFASDAAKMWITFRCVKTFHSNRVHQKWVNSTEIVYIPIVDNLDFFVDNLWRNRRSLRSRVRKFKGGQFAQRSEAKLLQKRGRGCVEHGATRAHAASNFGDEGAGEEGAQDATAVNTTNGVNLGSGEGLAIRDNRQHLQGGTREPPARLHTQKAPDRLGGLWGTDELHQIAVALDAHAALTAGTGQLGEGRLDGSAGYLDDPGELDDAHWFTRDKK